LPLGDVFVITDASALDETNDGTMEGEDVKDGSSTAEATVENCTYACEMEGYSNN